MKYIKYLALTLFTWFRKLFGLVLFWPAMPFRRYSRSVVQNYALQQKISLRRLEQRLPERTDDGWILKDVHNVGKEGFVKHRNVSTLEFWLVVFLLWGWVDDDSNEDTFSAGHLSRYLTGDLKNSIMSRLFRRYMQKAFDSSSYGNTFDLGDKRAEDPNYAFIPALIWNTRNTAYNFQYLFESTSNPKDVFLIKIGSWQFGWVPQSDTEDKKWWKMIIGKNW